jgi:sugar/nucleoside kinase (ribokinase family)
MKKISLLHNNVFLDTKKLLGDWCDDMRYIKINYYEHNRTKHLLDKEIYDRLIITLGSGGCEYKSKTFPVARVEIKDSSGGGDTFIAGFVAEYLKTDDIERAIMFANDCATKVVQKRGVSVV